jgi:uncharacterized protein YqgC (DUF456 family)
VEGKMRAMSGLAELGIAALMLVGLIGVLVPLVPGTALVLGAGVLWAALDGGGAGRSLVVTVMAVLFLVGFVLKYVLPGKRLAGGLPRDDLLWGLAGAAVGFVVIPVVGLPIGAIAGVYLAELSRLEDREQAWQATVLVLKAIGLSLLVELVAGVLMVLVWFGGVLAT